MSSIYNLLNFFVAGTLVIYLVYFLGFPGFSSFVLSGSFGLIAFRRFRGRRLSNMLHLTLILFLLLLRFL